MRFSVDDDTRALLSEVDGVLASAGDVGSRELFGLLGARRLVAAHYPREYGGRGLTLAHHVSVSERLGLAGLPDEVHLVTVQGVGCSLLVSGQESQRRRWLPEIAAGRAFASLLLTEAGAGSDLTAIESRAEADGDGYRVTGQKTWNLYADWSSFGICSVRTRRGEDRYDGISFLLIPFDAPGVSVEPVPRLLGEPYFTVTFDGVRVGQDALIGPEHRGWPLLIQAIGFERAGFDYLSRARRWLRTAEEVVSDVRGPDRLNLRAELLRHERAVANARALAFRAAGQAQRFEMDEVASAYSKYACGEAAQRLARWMGLELGAAVRERGAERRAEALRRALAEAPELSISGGARELQLDLIAMDQNAGTG
ncbi:acyl-CoA dehydrogenase family protein [Nonomuraea sp. NPDC049758]|uniref:acyl-CoA dehydrogenase family protein n=1 Tax=Nonomuraea sp. NPDC049758 TaxID=3154360 RepID=UPI00341CD1F7